jgi:hypothetical protein
MTHKRFHHASASASYAVAVNIRTPKLPELPGFNSSSPIKFVAAEAGFLPPGPFIDFADIVRSELALDGV